MRSTTLAILLLALVMLGACASSPPPRSSSSSRTDSIPAAPGYTPGGAATREMPATSRTRGEEIADVALTLRGRPYRYGGATPEGFDCSGLVFFTHRQFGLSVPRTSRDQAKNARPVKQGRLRTGDLVFFKIGSRQVNHVGIFIGGREFVHAPRSGRPVTVNSLDEEYYAKHFDSAGRYWSDRDD